LGVIYFKTADGRRILILEPRSLDMLKQGLPCEAPDKSTVIVYTPDVEWTFGEIQKLLGPDGKVILPQELDKILQSGLQRPPVVRSMKEMQKPRVFGPSTKGKINVG
jgi:hypothetical protein